MIRDPIYRTRYRTLQAALTLIGLLALGGALSMVELPRVHPLEVGLFVFGTVCCLGLVPVAWRAAQRGDRAALERIAILGLAIGSVLLLQRIFSTLYGGLFEDPTRDLFRLHFAGSVVLFLSAVAVMRARVALRYCWFLWGLIVAITLPGLWLATGFDTSRPGLVSVLVWLLVANPLLILLMHALPQYEEQLDRSAREVATMRERTELMDKLAESERRFNLVVDGLEVGVWDRWAGPPERRWWSPRFFELLGYAPGDITPDEVTLRGLLHPDDRERVWKLGTEQLAKGDLMDLDFRFYTKHRGYRWFNSRARAERGPNGRLLRLAGSLTDIHDKRVAEDALHAAQAELTRLAYRDTLTDLHNRRYFDEHFQREWERARRSRQPLALVLVDLDHFKAFNDRYGHPAGDSCLVEFSHLLTRCATRPADIVARLGGEEFGLVLPETSALGGEEVAQRLQMLLRHTHIPHEAAPAGMLTFSAGVAAIESPDGPGPAELFEHADRALYEVKRRGRGGVLRHIDEASLQDQAKLFPDAGAYAGNKPR
ncbi:MAG: diguanylate cyclase domain-containing protein [Nevskiaceae bacterium]